MHRRAFLKLGAGLAAACQLPSAWASSGTGRLISAATDKQGQHYLCAWHDGRVQFRHPIAERAHAPRFHIQRNELLYFSRRPGTSIHILDGDTGQQRLELRSPAGSHFYGHGCINRDGSRLYVSENDVAAGGRGRIAVYDCSDNYRRIGRFDSGGIGPHELALLPDDKTLVVANGGILTLPDQRRRKLNLDTMAPRLTYLDSSDGKELASLAPPHHQLSLRHLAVAGDGSVIVGAQYQGEGAVQWPLVFVHRPGSTALQAMDASDADWRKQHNYIASVAVSSDSRQVLTTSPRGGVATLWQLDNATQQSQFAVRDVAGADYDRRRQRFCLSNGQGQIFQLSANSGRMTLLDYQAELRWDNHLQIVES